MFFQKKHPKSAKRLISIWEKVTFLFAQLCQVVARTLCPNKKCPFLGRKTLILAQIIRFLLNDPKLCQWRVGSPRQGRPFPTFRSIFRFSITVVFVKKKRPTRHKVFLNPTMRAPSASNSPSALKYKYETDPNISFSLEIFPLAIISLEHITLTQK